MTKETKRLMLEMVVGMLGYELVLAVIAWLFHGSFEYAMGPVLLGLAAGFAADVLMLIHMGYLMERVADSMDAAYAQKITTIHSILRKVVFIVVLIFLGTRPGINVVAMIIGALGLKFGALLQPPVHKAFLKGTKSR